VSLGLRHMLYAKVALGSFSFAQLIRHVLLRENIIHNIVTKHIEDNQMGVNREMVELKDDRPIFYTERFQTGYLV
jgi:hypothetical protein